MGIDISNMGWVDIVFIVVMLWAVIVGYRSGFVQEFPKFLAVVLGLFLTFHYIEPAASWVKRNSFIPAEVAVPLVYVVFLIVSIVLIATLLQLLGKLFEVKVFSVLEKGGGIVLALARYALILGLISHFIFFFSMPVVDESYKKSIAGPYLMSVCQKTYRGIEKLVPLPVLRLEPQVTAVA
ncbi:MAG: CvpA family protein [Candidatus Omnitrophica bacterium]|nr:CvpA family protein [Candidatus Omnitrophota bacterium]